MTAAIHTSLSVFLEDGCAFWLPAPEPCALCGEAHMFFRQRDGRTRCAGCDIRYLDSGRQIELLPASSLEAT